MPWRCASGELTTDGFLNGRGQLAKILSLCGTATASGIVPRRDEQTRFFVAFDCERSIEFYVSRSEVVPVQDA